MPTKCSAYACNIYCGELFPCFWQAGCDKCSGCSCRHGCIYCAKCSNCECRPKYPRCVKFYDVFLCTYCVGCYNKFVIVYSKIFDFFCSACFCMILCILMAGGFAIWTIISICTQGIFGSLPLMIILAICCVCALFCCCSGGGGSGSGGGDTYLLIRV